MKFLAKPFLQVMSIGYWIVLFAFGVFAAAAVQAENAIKKPTKEAKPFYLTLETPPAPELSPTEALAGFTVAPGFEIELVAAEPLVEDPVAITWDEHGHLYVVEMRGYMPDVYGNGEKEPVGVVARLRDTNGDGKPDQREILLDKLVLPRAIALVNDGLLIGEPPNLWLCPSDTGKSIDIDCGKKRRLGTYGDQPGSVEHVENGLMTGLDNWLYSAKSNRRLRVINGQLQVEPTLFRGQWGITQDNEGRLYYNTNSRLLLGDAYDAQALVNAGNSSAPGLASAVSKNDQLFASRVNPGVNRAYVPGVLRSDGRLNRPTSASGMTVYRGDQFTGELYVDDEPAVFVAEPAANAIVLLKLDQQGLALSSQHILYPNEQWGQVEFFSSTDERFRPVDVENGPDGSLYVVDMYRGIIQDHYFLSDELRAQALARQLEKPLGMGRIWRVVAKEGKPLSNAHNLSSSSTRQLIDFLGHSNAWHRETAQRLLLRRTGPGVTQTLEQVIESGSVFQAVHALWVLAFQSKLSRETVITALSRKEAEVRLSAVRAGHQLLRRNDLLEFAQGAIDPAVLQQLTMSLAPHSADRKVRQYLIRSLAENAQDPYLPAAIKAAVYQNELLFLAALQTAELWTVERELRTGFVKELVTQGVRADPQIAAEVLDFVVGKAAHHAWFQIAMLDGLYDLSRSEGFERIVLAKSHKAFVTENKSLWPALARARRALTWPGDELAADAKPLTPDQERHRIEGAAYYRSRCASCHGAQGKGIAGLAPPLANSHWVTGPSEPLIRILLHGLKGPIEVAGTTWNGLMPGHGNQSEFTDQLASGLMTYLHRAWGHSGRAIDPGFVQTARQATKGRTSMWSASELEVIEINTHYARLTGRYGSPEFVLEFSYDGTQLSVKSGIFNGVMKPLAEDQFVFEPRALRIEFVFDDEGTVIGLRTPRGDSEILLPRLEDQVES